MNKVRVQGKIVKDVYNGKGKSGPYTAGTIAVKDGDYDFWLTFYAPNNAALSGAFQEEIWQLDGSLAETKRKDKDGKEFRQIQVKVEQATKISGPSVNQKDKYDF